MTELDHWTRRRSATGSVKLALHSVLAMDLTHAAAKSASTPFLRADAGHKIVVKPVSAASTPTEPHISLEVRPLWCLTSDLYRMTSFTSEMNGVSTHLIKPSWFGSFWHATLRMIDSSLSQYQKKNNKKTEKDWFNGGYCMNNSVDLSAVYRGGKRVLWWSSEYRVCVIDPFYAAPKIRSDGKLVGRRWKDSFFFAVSFFFALKDAY